MTNQDTTQSITKGALRFFSGTLVSRCTGLGREVAMASLFGVSPAVAAFWMAFRFSHLLRRILGEGALHTAFIPHFEKLRVQHPSSSARFFYDLSISLILFLCLLLFVVETSLGCLLFYGHLQSTTREIVRLTMFLLPTILFIVLYALNSAVLYCEQSYFLSSVAPAALNVVWIVTILCVRHLPTMRALEYLSLVLIFAFALQWAVTLPRLFAYLVQTLGRGWYTLRFTGRECISLLRPFSLSLLGVAATQINSAVDTLFARASSLEGPAYLWYALRIQQLPLAIVGVGLTSALLPPISRAMAKKEGAQYVEFLQFAIERALLFLLPLTGFLFALGYASINLVYGHGAFSPSAIYATTTCLWCYGLGLFPMSVVLLFAAAFYGQRNYKVPTLFSILAVAVNIGLNALLVYVWCQSYCSIALSTTASACINASCLGYILLKKHYWSATPCLRLAGKVGLASLIAACCAVVGGHYWCGDNTLLWLCQQPLVAFPRELTRQLWVWGIESLLFSTTFLVASLALRIEAVYALFSILRKKKEGTQA